MYLTNWEFRSSDGMPLTGLTVKLYAASTLQPNPGAVIATTVTDLNGMWTFTGLPTAAYDVKVEAPGITQVKWYKGMTSFGVASIYASDDTAAGDHVNRVINGEMQVASHYNVTNTDNTYSFIDRWRILMAVASGYVVTQEVTDIPATGSPYTAKIAVGSGGANTKGGIITFLEGIDCRDLRGKTVSLQATVKSNASINAVKMAIIEYTGAVDAVGADPVSAWNAAGTDPTLANASYVYRGTVAITPTTSHVVYKSEGIVLGLSLTNLAVFVWTDDATVTIADYICVTDVQLEEGARCSRIARRPIGAELALCQRYWEVIGVGGSGPTIIGTGQVISTAQVNVQWQFKVRKRLAVTNVAVNGSFLVSALGAFLNNGSAYNSFQANGNDSVTLQFSSSGLTTGNASVVGTDGNSYIMASAEL